MSDDSSSDPEETLGLLQCVLGDDKVCAFPATATDEQTLQTMEGGIGATAAANSKLSKLQVDLTQMSVKKFKESRGMLLSTLKALLAEEIQLAYEALRILHTQQQYKMKRSTKPKELEAPQAPSNAMIESQKAWMAKSTESIRTEQTKLVKHWKQVRELEHRIQALALKKAYNGYSHTATLVKQWRLNWFDAIKTEICRAFGIIQNLETQVADTQAALVVKKDELQQAKKTHQEKINTLKQSHQQEIDTLKQTNTKQVTTLQQDLRNQEDLHNNTLQKTIASATRELTIKLKETTVINKRLLQTTKQQQDNIDTLTTKLDKLVPSRCVMWMLLLSTLLLHARATIETRSVLCSWHAAWKSCVQHTVITRQPRQLPNSKKHKQRKEQSQTDIGSNHNETTAQTTALQELNAKQEARITMLAQSLEEHKTLITDLEIQLAKQKQSSPEHHLQQTIEQLQTENAQLKWQKQCIQSTIVTAHYQMQSATQVLAWQLEQN